MLPFVALVAFAVVSVSGLDALFSSVTYVSFSDKCDFNRVLRSLHAAVDSWLDCWCSIFSLDTTLYLLGCFDFGVSVVLGAGCSGAENEPLLVCLVFLEDEPAADLCLPFLHGFSSVCC